jgi:hypothetical protein
MKKKFGKLFEKTTSQIKSKANDAFSQSIDIASDKLQAGKDTVLKNSINIFIKSFGEIRDLKIDTKRKALSISIFLKGEKGEVELKVSNYKISKDDDDSYYVEIFEMSANRYWIDAIVKSFIVGQRFVILPNLVVPLKILM